MMKGNLIACPNTNQTSATRPTQMPATSERSEILPRISQVGIPQRGATPIKIDIFLDLKDEVTHTLSIRLLRCASRGFDRFLELACLRVSSSKCSNEYRIIVVGELICFCRELHCDFGISERIIRAGRHQPGEVVEREDGIGF